MNVLPGEWIQDIKLSYTDSSVTSITVLNNAGGQITRGATAISDETKTFQFDENKRFIAFSSAYLDSASIYRLGVITHPLGCNPQEQEVVAPIEPKECFTRSSAIFGGLKTTDEEIIDNFDTLSGVVKDGNYRLGGIRACQDASTSQLTAI